MTTEQAIHEIEDAESQFDFEFRKAIRNRDEAIWLILQEWGEEHKRFDIGDFVISDKTIVRIENYEIVRNNELNDLYIRYSGIRFRLDGDILVSCGSHTFFYEDSSWRLFNPLLRKRKQILVKIKN